MSSTVSPFSITALNQQTNAVKSLIPTLDKVARSNSQVAQASLGATKAIEKSPNEIKASLDRLQAVLRKGLVSFIDDWNTGQAAAWKTYTDKDARSKDIQSAVGKTLEGSQTYLQAVLTRGMKTEDGKKVEPKFRQMVADPVLEELRSVVAREAIIGISGAVARSEWWQSLIDSLPKAEPPGWKPVEVTADWGGPVPSQDSMVGMAGTLLEPALEPSIWTAGALAAWEEYLAKAGGIAGMVETLFNDSLSRTQDYLISAMTDGKTSFRALADAVIVDISRVASRMAVSGLGQLFGYGAQAFASSGWGQAILSVFQADGGAWNHGVQMYARGGAFRHGVVSSPTLFGAAGGRLGVMGEAGPEAIMPLARTPDGALGVRTLGGGGTTVQLHAPVSVSIADGAGNGRQIDQQALSSNLQRQLQLAAERAVAESWRPGGTSYRNARGMG